MMNSTSENPAQLAPSDRASKAPYSKPALRTFGSVKQLTKGGGGSKFDGNGLSKDKNGT